MKIDVLKSSAIFKANRAQLLLKKHSPELLLGGGIAGMLVATVLACNSTLKAVKIVEDAKEINEAFDIAAEANEEYKETSYNSDRILLGTQVGLDLLQAYGPSLIIGGVSIGMLIGSNRILNSRNAALIGAYKVLDEAYKRYRDRVREELGEEVDEYFLYRKKYDGELRVAEKGKTKDPKLNEMEVDLPGELEDDMPSPYAMFFDASSPQWRQTNEFNIFFLRSQQAFANDLLKARGHVFLNEVYDMVGIPRTKAGAVVGWVWNEDDLYPGDGYIDFDIYNPYNERNRDFVNGYEHKAMLLDFNVDGIIFDKI